MGETSDRAPGTRDGERLRALHDMNRAVLTAVSARALARAALERLAPLLSCRRASLGLFDFEARAATVLAAFDPGAAPAPPRTRLALDAFGDLARLWQGQVDLIRDLPPTPTADALGGAGLRSALHVPLIARDHLIGCLSLGAERPDAFPPESVEVARALADQLAVALRQAQLSAQYRAARRRLRALSRRLLEVQEAERRRLAHDLHDEIGQALTAVKINLQGLPQPPAGTPAARRLGEGVELVERALGQVRDFALELRPFLLDAFGLVPALRGYVERLARRSGLAVQLTADAPATRLPAAVETACFRVAQEALTNVVRHARARRVEVELCQGGAELELTVRDDGVGFDVRAARGASLGLPGMAERVRLVRGELTVRAAPGRGTCVRARFPLAPAAGGRRQRSPA